MLTKNLQEYGRRANIEYYNINNSELLSGFFISPYNKFNLRTAK